MPEKQKTGIGFKTCYQRSLPTSLLPPERKSRERFGGAACEANLGKTSRYYPPFFTRSFPGLLNALETLSYLKQQKGTYSGMPALSRRTTIKAGSALIALVEKHQITFDDLALSDHEEVIILKRAKRDH